MSSQQRSVAAAVLLFFVAPLVAEFLLGDFSISYLWLLIPMAPMYGGGALLIRELTRRSGRGWPTILLLGAAYMLVEEGFTTQSLFNPNYLGMHFLKYAWIPALGIGGWWTLLMFNVHVFFSIGVSIALVEGLFAGRGRTPWLGKLGIGVAAALFAVGLVMNTAISLRQNHFRASTAQLVVVGLMAVALVVAALMLPKVAARTNEGWVPPAWVAGGVAFVLGAALMLSPPDRGWVTCAFIFAMDVLFLVCLGVLSRRRGWTALETFSVGAGGAVFYGVHAFMQPPVLPSRPWIVQSGHVVFLGLTVWLIVVAVGRLMRLAAVEGSIPA